MVASVRAVDVIHERQLLENASCVEDEREEKRRNFGSNQFVDDNIDITYQLSFSVSTISEAN